MSKADTEKKAKKAAYMKEYYQKNKERIKEYYQKYQEENRDRLKAYHRAKWKRRALEISEKRRKQYRDKTLLKWNKDKPSEQ